MLPRSLYIHVPFCARRCSYCDFAIAVRPVVPVDEYVGAVGRELALRHGGGPRLELDTLYLGGGTPSRLGGEGVARLLEGVEGVASLAPSAEVTIEANPEDVTADAVRAWRRAGVNRMSLGAQTFDDAVLRWMHRVHDAGAIVRAMDVARAEGFENISLDLIFALPSSLNRSWRDDVDRALALAPEHVSFYGLTVEPHTPLGQWRARGEVAEAPEEAYETEFLHGHDALAAAGFEHYEVSSFARPGLASRHNANYWTGAPYAGVGPSAHAFDGARRRWNVKPWARWSAMVGAGEDPSGGEELLTAENRRAEQVYLGLRTRTGLAIEDGEAARVAPWVAAGWASVSDGRLTLTALGWLRLDSLAADLTAFRSRSYL